jgi:fermentation-respiration switch protein FrsA (DUF1100 family)
MRPLIALMVFALTAATGCSVVSGGAAAIENRIVFQPEKTPSTESSYFALTNFQFVTFGPDEPFIPGLRPVWMDSTDGVRLHGWFAQPNGKPPRAVILYCHGNGGNITTRTHVLNDFRDRFDCAILIFDYRGYGRSTGSPTEAGVLDDARAARRWLAERTQVRESDIVLVGHSLGGGVAVDLAARDGARGLILQGTFTNLPDVAASHVPLLPVRAVMQASLDSEAKIKRYRGPLLQVHGDADPVVPYALGRRLHAAANEPKQFITIPGGDHNNFDTPEFVAALDSFLNRLPRHETEPAMPQPGIH